MIDSERRTQIITLLETLNDGLPVKSRRDHSTAGFVHNTAARLSCPDCLTNDRVLYGCETCGGRGFVEELRERDPYAVEKVQPYGMSVDRHERVRDRDRQIARLADQTAAPRTEQDLLAEANQNAYPWERERRMMFLRFDYAAVTAALEQLRDHDDGMSRAVHAAYVYGWVEMLSASFEAAVEGGLRFIDARMPDPIRAPGRVHPAEARAQKRRAA